MSKDYYRDKRLTDDSVNEATLFFEGSGRLVRLDKKMMIIGRDESCDITLNASTISRNHARIFTDGADWYLEDLGSVNGMTVNGKPVNPYETVRLFNNCHIVFADNLTVCFRNERSSMRDDGETTFLNQNIPQRGPKEWENPYYSPRPAPQREMGTPPQPPQPPRQPQQLQPPRQPQPPQPPQQPQYGAYVPSAGPLPAQPAVKNKPKTKLRLVAVIVLAVVLAGMAAAWALLSGIDDVHINAGVYSMDYHRFLGKTKWTVTDNLTDAKTESVFLSEDGKHVEHASFEGEDGSIKVVFFRDDLPEYATIAGPDGTVTEIAYYPEDRLFTVTLGEDMYTYDYDGKLVETRQEETEDESIFSFGTETVSFGGEEVYPVLLSSPLTVNALSLSARATTEISGFYVLVLREGEEEWEPALLKSVDDGYTIEASIQFPEELSIVGIAIIPGCYEDLRINDMEVCAAVEGETGTGA